MSYGEEIAAEYYAYEGLIHSKIANGIWTMRDGAEINIREMSRKHLRNTIAMLKRKEEMTIYDEEWVAVMERELNFREYIDKIVKGEL